MDFEWPLAVVDRWPLFTGKSSTDIDGPDRGWSLLTGVRCSEVVVNTGLTVVIVNNIQKLVTAPCQN